MSRIRFENTQAELLVFSYLRKNKVYFQKHYKRVSGKPDIALPRKKIAVFIDGDFWHGRNKERLKNSENSDYWVKKINGNIERDIKINDYLLSNGWKILRVWESDIKRKSTREEVLLKIEAFLNHKA